MLDYTSGEKAVIDSNLHIGANRPLAEVTVSGAPTGGSLKDPTNWTGLLQQGSGSYVGNVASNAEGTPIMAYRIGDNSTVKVAFGTSWASILGGASDFDFANAVTVLTDKYRAIPIVSLDGEQLNLSIVWYNTATSKIVCEFWRDTTGIGDAFAYVSTVDAAIGASTNISGAGFWNWCTGYKRLSTGRLVIFAHYEYSGHGGLNSYYSDNNGASWTAGATSGWVYDRQFVGEITELDNGTFGIAYYNIAGNVYFIEFPESCASYEVRQFSGWGGVNNKPCICRLGNEMYMATYVNVYPDVYRIYKYTGATTATGTLIADANNWTLVKTGVAGTDWSPRYLTDCGGYLVFCSNNGVNFSVMGSEERGAQRLPVKSIEIDPAKNAAGQMTVVIDNKNGIYSPDRVGDWLHVLWPNHIATAKLGYGENREPVFYGMIDSIRMKTWPQEITVYARDKLKLALDQTVTDDAGLRSIAYTGCTLTEIFSNLAYRAGWALADIYCDACTTVVSITFTHVSYADAMQQLCELYNWEFYAGRSGQIYFRYVTDRQPEATDETKTLAGTTAVSLVKYPVVTASIRVRSAVAGGGTLYSAVTDYVVVEGDKDTSWTIARRSGSTIPDGGIVYVSYVYAAWVFQEGINVINLEYTIDDEGLYNSAAVIGKTATGAICHGVADYANADYYNVLDDKVLILNDDTAASVAACETVAARSVVSYAATVRKVTFDAVPVPYLWVGDCIMIVESSTTVSEIYRVTDIKHRYNGKGWTMSVEAKYYGYAPA